MARDKVCRGCGDEFDDLGLAVGTCWWCSQSEFSEMPADGLPAGTGDVEHGAVRGPSPVAPSPTSRFLADVFIVLAGAAIGGLLVLGAVAIGRAIWGY